MLYVLLSDTLINNGNDNDKKKTIPIQSLS